MAGRSLSAARAEQALQRAREAHETPTPKRDQPIPYTPDLPDEALALAAIGFTFVEIAAHWAISEEELMEWQKAHSDLAEALQRARTRAKAWWTRQPRLAIAAQDNKFPAGAWSQQVRALYPEYDDKKGVTVNLSLGDLVVIQRRPPPEPLGERVVSDDKPLIEGRTVRLAHSPTASDGPSGSTEPRPSPSSSDLIHDTTDDTRGPRG